MSNRVTEADVLAIMDTELTDVQIAPFVATANVMVTKVCGGDTDYGDEQLAEIERWLAAHFAAIRDPQIAAEKTGDGGVTYHGKSGQGLDHTPYGQQVKIIDHKGKFAAMSQHKEVASFEVMGVDLAES